MNIKAKNKKINNNMKKEELIGKKVRGFRFESNKNYGPQYMPNIMDKYVGKIGVIKDYNIMLENYGVKFEDGMSYHYPAERIEHHLVDEEPTIEGFTPIAMKCNQEQFDEIKLLLESGACKIVDITNFIQYCYLVNNFNEVQKDIGNVDEDMIEDFNRKVYHEWNKKIFLNACGIEWNESLKEDKGRYLEPTEENLKEFKKSLDQSAEEFINDANRHIIENEIKENSNSIGIHKLEPTNPLDDLPMIGDGVLMEVSRGNDEWLERNVFGKSELGFLAWYEDKSNINLWNLARPIAKTKITRKEFESKFEIID